MLDNYTDRARAVVASARAVALDMNIDAINIECLAVSLLSSSKSIAVAIVNRLSGGRSAEIWTEILKHNRRRGKRPNNEEFPLTPGAICVLNRAHAEASELSTKSISTEHLLLAILTEACPETKDFFEQRGVTYNTALAAIKSFNPEEFVSKEDRDVLAALMPYIQIKDGELIARAGATAARCPEKADSTADLRAILDRITFVKSCIDFNWKWEVSEVKELAPVTNRTDFSLVMSGPAVILTGWFVNTTFSRPDINTGAIGTGKGRKLFVEKGATATNIFFTCWVAIELIVKHELMEAVRFDGQRILNPHHTLEELALPDFLKARGATPEAVRKMLENA